MFESESFLDFEAWIWNLYGMGIYPSQFAVVQSLSHVRLFVTPWTVARQASLSFTISLSLLKLTSVVSMIPSSQLLLCRPLLPSIFPSIRVFYNQSTLHIRWLKFWRFSFNTSPFNEYSGLIFFRIDWFDLLLVQETLKSLLKHHTSKVSILQYSAFFRFNSHICTWLLEKLQLWLYKLLSAKWCLCFLICYLVLS